MLFDFFFFFTFFVMVMNDVLIAIFIAQNKDMCACVQNYPTNLNTPNHFCQWPQMAHNAFKRDKSDPLTLKNKIQKKKQKNSKSGCHVWHRKHSKHSQQSTYVYTHV